MVFAFQEQYLPWLLQVDISNNDMHFHGFGQPVESSLVFAPLQFQHPVRHIFPTVPQVALLHSVAAAARADARRLEEQAGSCCPTSPLLADPSHSVRVTASCCRTCRIQLGHAPTPCCYLLVVVLLVPPY
jgi:hypothetical protein